MGTSTNSTNTGLRARIGAARPAHPAEPDALPRALFVAELLAGGIAHVAQDNFPGEAPPAKLSKI